ncbi:Tetratricopeptide repeat-containing protein [Dethiosulfatibacter aminovorans DSM 17477]|uniref:Tetratricopeptide repeat-containing protein n=1 Tax=Dethiosulfatibacter aminovorans DSM 17477 TaxID=1121476 RepID=A0A1M6H1T9_9FIRM|nr:tetratricopeptide repeat protein [Dethiosulfatibacter aminovorans]SHJ16178.1 Tetratricopeptide repeat-containing protein [Dethiosulfatibacter aminovorans DSM 17477]
MKLELKLFGIPEIMLNGKRTEWSFKKAEALVIYLYMMKSAFKSDIADMLWGDTLNQEKTMQNYRNCIYTIRRALGKDIFIKKSGGIICLNDSYRITSDYDNLVSGKISVVDIEDVEFMKSYFLKESSLFNEWLDEKRNETRSFIIENSIAVIEDEISNGELDNAERIALKVMELDEFDERTYELLIQIYDAKGQFGKIIDLYNCLENLFREELAIAPSPSIKNLVEAARINRDRIQKKNSYGETEKSEIRLYGRNKERSSIRHEIQCFSEDHEASSIIVKGEEGIGKTSLVDSSTYKVSSKANIYRTQCYRAERNFILKPWYSVIQNISRNFRDVIETLPLNIVAPLVTVFPFLRTDKIMNDMEVDNIIFSNYEVIEREVVNLLLKIIENKKIIIIFEDIQWIDDVSLSLIRNILQMDKNRSLFLLMTARTPFPEKIDGMIYDMERSGYLSVINLDRFSKEETIEAARYISPDIELDENEADRLYLETEGNPFYIKEVLSSFIENGMFNNLTSNIKSLLHQRVSILNDEEKKILEIISVHFDGVRLAFLMNLSLTDEIKLVNILEKLIESNLVVERYENDDIVYQFSHMKIQEYVYAEMSRAKKKILHGKSASIFEDMLRDNGRESFYYSKIIYHYEKSGNIAKFIEYTIKYLYNHLCVAHEFFPVFEKQYETKVKIESENIEHHFSRIAKWVENVDLDLMEIETKNQISMFYHMIGRYYIRMGEYDKGKTYIEKLKMLNSVKIKQIDKKNIIKANRQLVCIYMNRFDQDDLGRIVEESLELVKDECDEEKAIWYRLKGYHGIMTGEIEKAREYLADSIRIFENSTEINKYIVNLAASHNWMGETYRIEGRYPDGSNHYERAISLCEESETLGGTPIFYANYGQYLFEMGKSDDSRVLFEKSLELYKMTDSLWGKSIPYSYLARMDFDMGKYDSAKSYIEKSIMYSKKLKSSYEKGICRNCAEYIIKRLNGEICTGASEIKSVLEKYLQISIKSTVK